MEQISAALSKEGVFTALTVIGIVYVFTKLIPMGFRAHKEIINRMLEDSKENLSKVTQAFMEQIKSNEQWRQTVDSHLRDHGSKLDKLNDTVSKIAQ